MFLNLSPQVFHGDELRKNHVYEPNLHKFGLAGHFLKRIKIVLSILISVFKIKANFAEIEKFDPKLGLQKDEH